MVVDIDRLAQVEFSVPGDPRLERSEICRFDQTELDDGVMPVVLDLGHDRALTCAGIETY